MLDLRAVSGTPGATTTNTQLATIATNDMSSSIGQPIKDKARLVMWGSQSLIANTIYGTKLNCLDCIDPINAEAVVLGATSLMNQFYRWTNIPYKGASRLIYQGTNTAQTATSTGFTLDYYDGGSVLPDYTRADILPNQICVSQTLNADVAVTWTNTSFSPTNALPQGKYALLGVYASAMTEGHLIRFAHADFGSFEAGFPMIGSATSAIIGWQKTPKDYLAASQGRQFVAISEFLGKSVIPVFTVGAGGTGLVIKSLAAAATDTPVLTLVLVKVG